MEISVKRLFALSEADLELELGRTLSTTAAEVESQAMLTAAQPGAMKSIDKEQLQSLPGTVRTIAHRFLKNFNTQMYSLVCDSRDPDNEKLRAAAKTSVESLGLVLSGIFVATFGWLPGIASVVAVLVAKRFGGAAYDAVCSTWKEQL
jgi:hypothetical protein